MKMMNNKVIAIGKKFNLSAPDATVSYAAVPDAAVSDIATTVSRAH